MDRGMRAWLLSWIETAHARGATTIIATHDIEPFVELAARAVVAANGVPTLHDPLPVAGEERGRLLDTWARGTTPVIPSERQRVEESLSSR